MSNDDMPAPADELVKRLRDAVNHCHDMAEAAGLMHEAADMIEQMAQRIEADTAAYEKLERNLAEFS